MEGINRKADMIDAAMRVVAEDGLTAFSMKKVTDRLGVSEALIYRYFETKENLLYACFETMHRQIAELFRQTAAPPSGGMEDAIPLIRGMWMSYFDLLVRSGYRTIFYFEYRDSSYIRRVLEEDGEVRQTYFHSFVGVFAALDSAFHICERTSPDHLWTYVLDTSGAFARRVIRGELPDTAESRENIWRLISGGLGGLLHTEDTA